MMSWQYPDFSFSAPMELVKRMDDTEHLSGTYRTEFMRDRDRILYCGSFRRLAGKTQIYLAGGDDHKRNRLTHTLEVSQIARTISRALGLDCDLTEAIALGHDLGHTPFGHAGEQILHMIMTPGSSDMVKTSPLKDIQAGKIPADIQNMYGFKHNIQSARLVVDLEDGHGDCGLNLTNFTLWGIQNHSAVVYSTKRMENYPDPDYRNQYLACCQQADTEKMSWSFEAFVVREADEIAQWHHDLEDALRGNAMTPTDVRETIQEDLDSIMPTEDREALECLKDLPFANRQYISILAKIVVNTLVNRIVECSLHNLKQLWEVEVKGPEGKLSFFKGHDSNEDCIQNAISLLKFGELSRGVKEMQKRYPITIREKIHHSMDVERMNVRGQYIIRKLFQAYWSHPQQLPDSAIRRYMTEVGEYENLDLAMQDGAGKVRMKFENFRNKDKGKTPENQIRLMRRVCDHIAGMTDRYAIEEYKNLYGRD